MTVCSRSLFAAAVAFGLAQGAPAAEPAALGVVIGPPVATSLPPAANQQLASTIADQLRQDARLRHYTVDVTFANGTAGLTGSVADQAQREEVLRVVQGVPGVERVRDQLTLAAGLLPVQALEQVPPASPTLPLPPPRMENAPLNAVEPAPIYQAAPPPSAYDLNPPKMPPYAWPTYAPYNNESRIGYPTLYPYNAWPFIGPNYPFPKVPPGWRSVKLEWQDGYWWYSTHGNSHDWWRLRYW